MVAESGAVLLDDAARAAIVEHLLPRATVITPNLPGGARARRGAAERAAGGRRARPRPRAARARPGEVVVTGGHRDEATDVFFDGERLERIAGERHPDGAAHGSGCTHSSALAAHLALGVTPLEAARAAQRIAGEAVRDGLRGIGDGRRAGRRPRADARRPPAAPGRPPALWHNRAAMKFLRMRPGHGEQLIAEGDLDVAEDEQRLVEEFRRQLDQGMWAAVPADRPRAAAARRR